MTTTRLDLQWPHLERHEQGRGLLEIKCPFKLCATPCLPLHTQHQFSTQDSTKLG